jgi:hypothetical protein
MCHKTFLWATIIVAVIIGLLSVSTQQGFAILAFHFFEVMLPVFGVAALLKFLACSHHQKCCCKGACENKSCDK